jgi:hypothetical protein
LVGNHDWKIPLGRHKHVLEDILDLKDISEDIDWIHLSQGKIQWKVVADKLGSLKGAEFIDKLSDCQLVRKR